MRRLGITLSIVTFFLIGSSQIAFAQTGGSSWLPSWGTSSSGPGPIRRGFDTIVAGPKYVFNKTSTATSTAWVKTRDALNPWKEEPAPAPWEPKKKKKESSSWSL